MSTIDEVQYQAAIAGGIRVAEMAHTSGWPFDAYETLKHRIDVLAPLAMPAMLPPLDLSKAKTTKDADTAIRAHARQITEAELVRDVAVKELASAKRMLAVAAKGEGPQWVARLSDEFDEKLAVYRAAAVVNSGERYWGWEDDAETLAYRATTQAAWQLDNLFMTRVAIAEGLNEEGAIWSWMAVIVPPEIGDAAGAAVTADLVEILSDPQRKWETPQKWHYLNACAPELRLARFDEMQARQSLFSRVRAEAAIPLMTPKGQEAAREERLVAALAR